MWTYLQGNTKQNKQTNKRIRNTMEEGKFEGTEEGPITCH